MGDIADMILDGILDEQTGEFIDDEISHSGGCGYPRSMNPPRTYNTGKSNLNGLYKYLRKRGVTKEKELNKIIQQAAKDIYKFEGTLKECAKQLQKDFGKFIKYYNKLKQ